MLNFYKYLVLITLIFSCVIPSFSQEFKGGLLMGMNGSQMSGDDMSGFDKGGFLGGVFIDYILSDKFEMSFELTYSQKGSRREISEKNLNPAGKWNSNKLSYLEVPLFAKYRFASFAPKIKFHFGFAYGILVRQTYIDSLGNDVSNQDIKPKTSDLSFVTGGEYQLSDRLVIFGRYVNSFVTIGKRETNPYWSKTNRGYLNIVASVGFRFYLGQNNNPK